MVLVKQLKCNKCNNDVVFNEDTTKTCFCWSCGYDLRKYHDDYSGMKHDKNLSYELLKLHKNKMDETLSEEHYLFLLAKVTLMPEFLNEEYLHEDVDELDLADEEALL